jgi:hypothetical protein
MKVFISYAHRDSVWLDRLLVHLKPLEESFQAEFWSDRKIQCGTKWREKLQKAIEESQIAIALISADFLASDFVAKNELPPLLQAAETEGKIVLFIILAPSLFEKIDALSQFQAFNDAESRFVFGSVGGGLTWSVLENFLLLGIMISRIRDITTFC